MRFQWPTLQLAPRLKAFTENGLVSLYSREFWYARLSGSSPVARDPSAPTTITKITKQKKKNLRKDMCDRSNPG